MAAARKLREETCEIVVVGAGMAGLMAATTLADRDVVVLEAADRAGGRVDTVRQGDYWINLGTQFTEGTGPLIDVLHRHQIPMGTLEGKSVALSLGGKAGRHLESLQPDAPVPDDLAGPTRTGGSRDPHPRERAVPGDESREPVGKAGPGEARRPSR